MTRQDVVNLVVRGVALGSALAMTLQQRWAMVAIFAAIALGAHWPLRKGVGS